MQCIKCSLSVLRMKVNFVIAQHFLHKSYGHQNLPKKLPNNVFFGKHVCIVILDLFQGLN